MLLSKEIAAAMSHVMEDADQNSQGWYSNLSLGRSNFGASRITAGTDERRCIRWVSGKVVQVVRTEGTQRAQIEPGGEVGATGRLRQLHGQQLQADEEILHNTAVAPSTPVVRKRSYSRK